MKLDPLVPGIGGGLLLAALLAPATGTALGKLASARDDRERLAQVAAAPASRSALVAPGQALDGDAGALAERIRARARSGGVLVEEAVDAGRTGRSGLVVVRFRVSGPEKAVVALADSLERDAPLVRLRGWRIVPIQGGVRLSGEAVAVRR